MKFWKNQEMSYALLSYLTTEIVAERNYNKI